MDMFLYIKRSHTQGNKALKLINIVQLHWFIASHIQDTVYMSRIPRWQPQDGRGLQFTCPESATHTISQYNPHIINTLINWYLLATSGSIC